MAKGNTKVFDSDIHCVEPPDLWDRYIDDRYKDRAPRTSQTAFECVLPFFQVDGRVMPAIFKDIPPHVTPEMLEKAMADSPQVELVKRKTRVKYKEFYDLQWSGEALLRAMDVEGVDYTVLFPTSGLLSMGLNEIEPDFAAAIARAYNDYLHDLCQADPGRLFGSAMISVHDVDNALAESERAVKELGFKSVFLRPNLVHARPWYDDYYEPLWSAVEELGVPVTFHEGIGAALPHVGDCFGANVYLHHVACHPMEMMLALMNFCGGGILERHPGLRVAFLEGNCGWLPWLLDRLDDHYELEFGVSAKTLPHAPSFYFGRQCYLSAECDENMIGDVIARVGDDNLIFSTDFPHPDSKYPRAVDTFLDKDDIPEDSKQKIVWTNSLKLYAMEDELS